MKQIIGNLNKFGAVTDGNFRATVGSDDLYVSSLDAFSLDDRFDKLGAQITAQKYADALKTARSLLESEQILELVPLIAPSEQLCAALETGSPKAIEASLSSYKEIISGFRNALSCG